VSSPGGLRIISSYLKKRPFYRAPKQATEAVLTLTLQDWALPHEIKVHLRACAGELLKGNPSVGELASKFAAQNTSSDGAKSRYRPAVVSWIANLLDNRHHPVYRFHFFLPSLLSCLCQCVWNFSCATLYCLGCYLYRNAQAQQVTVSKLSQPQGTAHPFIDNLLAAGALLLGALMDTSDGISNWLASLLGTCLSLLTVSTWSLSRLSIAHDLR
jgi:hypothetical protein